MNSKFATLNLNLFNEILNSRISNGRLEIFYLQNRENCTSCKAKSNRLMNNSSRNAAIIPVPVLDNKIEIH